MRFVMVQPGPTIGQLFDEFSKDGYLSLIYHNTNVTKRVTSLERRIIRIVTILAVIWITLYVYPFVRDYFDPPAVPPPELPFDLEES